MVGRTKHVNRGGVRARSTTAGSSRGPGELREVAIAQIDESLHPVRRDLGDLVALAESMQDYGLQQPIVVRAQGERLQLTCGLRRLAAARLLGWATIPAFVRAVDADQAYLLDLIENLQRQDLSADEEADALGELIRTRGWTLQQVADAIKRSVGYVSKRMRLFEDPYFREAIVERGLPISTAEELLAADGPLRMRLMERASSERWDQVRAREELAVARQWQSTADHVEPTLQKRSGAPTSAGRPRGLTRTIREFHTVLNGLEPTDLTPGDRAALRVLYRDLVMLARAPLTAQPRVFPQLPATATQTVGARRRGAARRRG
jgi:ParB/RepB/Spo0J family partition protein